MRNSFFKNLSSKCLAQIPEFFVGSHDFLDTNFNPLAFKSGLLSGKPNTGCFSGILSSLFSLFLYPFLHYTAEQVLTIFVKLHFYLKIAIKSNLRYNHKKVSIYEILTCARVFLFFCFHTTALQHSHKK